MEKNQMTDRDDSQLLKGTKKNKQVESKKKKPEPKSAMAKADAAAKRRTKLPKFRTQDPGKVKTIKTKAENMFDEF
jgi:hypothetical protein